MESNFTLIDSATICEQLRTQATKLARAGNLPLDCVGAIAMMQIAEARIAALSADLIKERTVPGWSGWTQIAEGWLIKITEHDGEVWLNLRGPQVAGHWQGLAIHKDSGSGQAQMLRQLRKQLEELQ